VDANVSRPRAATVTVLAYDGRGAGTVTVSQQGPIVTAPVTVTPASQQVSRGVQSVYVDLSATQSQCYVIGGKPSWLQLRGGTNRCGNARVEFTTTFNRGTTRSASISIGSATAVITQLGSR